MSSAAKVTGMRPDDDECINSGSGTAISSLREPLTSLSLIF